MCVIINVISSLFGLQIEWDYIESFDNKNGASACIMFLHYHNQVPRENNLKEEMFILAPSFRDVSPYWRKSIAEQNSSFMS